MEPFQCPQDGFTCPTTGAAPVLARQVNTSWYFPEFSDGSFTKFIITNYASYTILFALKKKAYSPPFQNYMDSVYF